MIAGRIQPNVKRGRKERRAADVYRLVPVFDVEARKEWPDSPHWVIEGELDGRLVVSCPVTTSIESMRRIEAEVGAAFKRSVAVINHNMELLVAERLPRNEAAQALKRIDDYAEARREAFKKEALADDPSGEQHGPGPATPLDAG